MISTIIFDFGDIFIDLDKEKCFDEFRKLGLTELHEDLKIQNSLFEIGKITELEFIQGYQKYIPQASIEQIRRAWNSLIGDFPLHRLEFLQLLSKKYQLFLLSNTDSIHISHFEHKVGVSFYSDFYQCFEKIYYSHELKMRKPDPEIFNFILNKHDLSPKRTLFVDDRKENTDMAKSLGMQIWNLQVGKEDVIELKFPTF